MKSIMIKSIGCVLNQLDGSRLELNAVNNGFKMSNSYDKADVLVINSCGFSNFKENLSMRTIRAAQRFRKIDSQLIVVGCLPRINPTRLRSVYNGVTYNPDELDEVEKKLGICTNSEINCVGKVSFNQYPLTKKLIYMCVNGSTKLPFLFHYKELQRIISSLHSYSNKVYSVRIATGCTGNCSYCAIKFAKGNIISRPLADILRDVRKAVNLGYREISLVGDEIGSYGKDMDDVSLLDILKVMFELREIEAIYLPWVHPLFLISHKNELLPFISSGKIKLIDTPVQSGCNRILTAMNRKYRIEEFVDTIKKIRDTNPSTIIRTDLIIGFPGETEEDFRQTYDFVNEMDFDFIHVYPYDDKPQTTASTMPSKIDSRIIERRRRQILECFFKKKMRFSNIAYEFCSLLNA